VSQSAIPEEERRRHQPRGIPKEAANAQSLADIIVDDTGHRLAKRRFRRWPAPNPIPRSALVSDIFFFRANACNVPNSICGPDNLVTNPFGSLMSFFVPVSQTYQLLFIYTDIEGSVKVIDSGTFFLAAGSYTFFDNSGVSLPGAGNVATGGLYKFLAVIVGLDAGGAAFSDYYQFRVTP
jgi:hypothetical protein